MCGNNVPTHLSFHTATQRRAKRGEPLRGVEASPRRDASLSLLRTAAGHPMLVELKSGETYNGELVSCDNWMNIRYAFSCRNHGLFLSGPALCLAIRFLSI